MSPEPTQTPRSREDRTRQVARALELSARAGNRRHVPVESVLLPEDDDED